MKDVKSNQRLYLNEAEAVSTAENYKSSPTYFSQINENPLKARENKYQSRDFDRQILIMQDFSKRGADIALADLDEDGIKV
jgi:hypothetical protein